SARADLTDAFARLDRCGADAELVTLAKRLLGAEPEDRPPDAGGVAEAVAGYLAGGEERLRATELERGAAEARAQEAKAAAAGEREGRSGGGGGAADGGPGGGGAGAGERGRVGRPVVAAAAGRAAGGSRSTAPGVRGGPGPNCLAT